MAAKEFDPSQFKRRHLVFIKTAANHHLHGHHLYLRVDHIGHSDLAELHPEASRIGLHNCDLAQSFDRRLHNDQPGPHRLLYRAYL